MLEDEGWEDEGLRDVGDLDVTAVKFGWLGVELSARDRM